MANIASQKKRNLRTERERLENKRYTSTMKTYLRRLESATEAGDADAAGEALRLYQKTVDKAAKVGAIHKNTASRKKARAVRIRRAGAAA